MRACAVGRSIEADNEVVIPRACVSGKHAIISIDVADPCSVDSDRRSRLHLVESADGSSQLLVDVEEIYITGLAIVCSVRSVVLLLLLLCCENVLFRSLLFVVVVCAHHSTCGFRWIKFYGRDRC